MAFIVPWPPCAKIKTITPNLNQPAQVNESEFTGASKTTILAIAPRWSFKVEPYPAADQIQRELWEAFIIDLQGQAGSFRLPLGKPQLGFDPQVSVSGAGQSGYSINLKTVSAVTLRRGMKLTINDMLVSVMTTTPFAAGSTHAVPIKPYLRVPPANNARVEADQPTALVSMSTGDGSWTLDDLSILGTSFECREKF